MRITLEILKKLQAEGKIKSFSDRKPEKNNSGKSVKNIPIKNKGKRSKTKEWIELNLWYWCGANGYELVTELVFHKERKWRFDWAIFKGRTQEQIQSKTYDQSNIICAIEYEGLLSKKSRHTTINGFTGDTEKYNAAATMGWKVYRYTGKNYKQMIKELNKLL